MNIELRLPSGIKELNPSEDRLRELLAVHQPEFWEAGSGQLSLIFRLAKGSPSLALTRKEPFGFQLQFGLMDSTETSVAVSSENYSQLTEILLGGEPWRIPTAFFIPEQAALAAVFRFRLDGRLPDGVKWVSLNTQKW